jgi:hypothetical protein
VKAAPNPIDGFTVDRTAVSYIGHALQRPECILAERDGSLWTADARGGVVHLRPDGAQELITQCVAKDFSGGGEEVSRFVTGTLPNGLAFARSGDFLIANFGTDRLELMSRTGETRTLIDAIDGEPIGKVNFVLRDSKDRLWLTISTRIKDWTRAVRPSLADGYVAVHDGTSLRIVADDFGSPTRSASMPARNGSMSSRPAVPASRGYAFSRMAVWSTGKPSGRPITALSSMASRSTLTAICGAPIFSRTGCSQSRPKATCASFSMTIVRASQGRR